MLPNFFEKLEYINSVEYKGLEYAIYKKDDRYYMFNLSPKVYDEGHFVTLHKNDLKEIGEYLENHVEEDLVHTFDKMKTKFSYGNSNLRYFYELSGRKLDYRILHLMLLFSGLDKVEILKKGNDYHLRKKK